MTRTSTLRFAILFVLAALALTLTSCEFLMDEFVTIDSSGSEFEKLLERVEQG